MEKINTHILSIDAKDIYLSQLSNSQKDVSSCFYDEKGKLRFSRFGSVLDDSLEFRKVKAIFDQMYPHKSFSLIHEDKQYAQSIINLTFHFSVKQFNSYRDGVYVRYDIPAGSIELEDCLYMLDGKLGAIRTNEKVEHPVADGVLEPCFYYDKKTSTYAVKPYIPTVVSVAELRRKLYTDGFSCNGIHYIRYKRSAGSSRVGKCLFIDERLYPKIHEWEMCGLAIPADKDIDLAALESYLSLPLSSIIGTLEIRPENILILDDIPSRFTDRIAAVTMKKGHLCAAEAKMNLENNIFDGQSLIDPAIMGPYKKHGFILLRNRMFKSACFNCNIQMWFHDNGIKEISQLKGKTRAKRLSDVLLITTPSSIKYLKFGGLEAWLDSLEPAFGVVKHDKPTPFFEGRLVQLHYQLLNTLHLSQGEVDQLLKPTLDYLRLLKTDSAVFRFHIGMKSVPEMDDTELLSKNEIVYKLLGMNDGFVHTKLYQNFRAEVLKAFTYNVRRGHVLVNGNYSTLCGNPIEMLQLSCGLFEGKSQIGVGNVYTKRFSAGEEILGCRSPHVTMGNIWLARNTANLEIEKYLNLTENIVCVNSIGENLLSRLSGCDFDSDSVLLTDEPILLGAAKKHYADFLVPTSCITARKITRKYTQKEKADLDIRTSVNRIGEIVNLSQELNSLFWDKVNSGMSISSLSELYYDISVLDVLSNIEIDKAKREYPIDSGAEIKRLKMKYQVSDSSGRQVKPNFFGFLAKSKGFYDSQKKRYSFYKTTMDFLQHSINRYRSPICKEKKVLLSKIFEAPDYHYSKVSYRQVNRVIASVREAKKEIHAVWSSEDQEMNREKKFYITKDIQERLSMTIAGISMNPSTMYRLLRALEEEKNRDISRMLFYSLFSTANSSFYQLIRLSCTPVPILKPDLHGDISLYGFNYRKE